MNYAVLSQKEWNGLVIALEAISSQVQDKSRGRIARAVNRARELGLRKLFDLACRHGVAGCLEFAIRNIRHIVAVRVTRRWDRKHGVDTSGSVQLSSLTIASQNRDFGNECLCISPDMFDFATRSLPSDLSGYTFVDIGAGKSRTLLLASRHNFERIIGVEFARELVEYSKYNLLHFRAKWQRCHDLQIVEMDATEYAFPDTPLVLFFYNPFKREVFIEVLNNILTSLRERERDCYILFCSSSHNAIEWARPLILGNGRFKEIPTQSMPTFIDAVRSVRFGVFRTV